MKSFSKLFCLLIPLLLIFSCSDDKEPTMLKVPTTEVKFDSYDVQSKTITIETNVDWNITTKPFWLQVEPMSGNAGTHVITITSTLATRNENREATFKIIASDLSKDVFVTQPGVGNINISDPEITLLKEDESAKFVFETSKDWEIECEATWLTITPLSGKAGKHEITVTPKALNDDYKDRIAELNILSFGNTKQVFVTQETVIPFHKDKEVVLLQKATKGKGVDLIFMGEGFIVKDLVKHKSGKYEKAMHDAANHFFSIYPYTEYRDYFNIYMVVAESLEEGVGNSKGQVDNKFESYYGDGTIIRCNEDKCIEYTKLIGGLNGKVITEYDLKDMSVVLVLNSDKYAGTAKKRLSGFSIAMCPMHPKHFGGLIHHESGGHGFGRLADEYVNSQNKTTSIYTGGTSWVNMIRSYHEVGGYANADLTNDPQKVVWKDFLEHEKYPTVGCFEGAVYYGKDVWKPEEVKTCMDNNVPYYNAPSRYSIVARIMEIAGVDFSFEKFVQIDDVEKAWAAYPKTKSTEILPPLAPPIIIPE